jgi:hypothetical protein
MSEEISVKKKIEIDDFVCYDLSQLIMLQKPMKNMYVASLFQKEMRIKFFKHLKKVQFKTNIYEL